MNERTFSRDWLEQHYISLDAENSRVVHREVIENREWGALCAAVIRDDDKFWRLKYREVCLGEVGDPWFDADQVSAVEVRPVVSLSTKWIPYATSIVPQPTCRHLTAQGEVDDCKSLAAWAVACLVGTTPLETHLCDDHLRDALRIRKELVDIREMKRW